MEILGIIPARGGSKGIKRKNLKEILGKPLVAYSIEAGLNSKLNTRTVVSTEDSEIKEVSLKYGAEVIDRPMELAQDETKTAPVMTQVIDELEKFAQNNKDCKIADDNREGIRITTPYGWMLLRLSGHDPVMPINFESYDIGGTAKNVEFFRSFYERFELLDLSSYK